LGEWGAVPIAGGAVPWHRAQMLLLMRGARGRAVGTKACPDCGHEVKPATVWERWLGALLRRSPTCTAPADDGMSPSGWPEECGCGHLVHAGHLA